VKGLITTRTPAFFIDINIDAGTKYEHIIPEGWNCMIIVHQGSLKVQDTEKVSSGGACVFTKKANDEEKLIFEGLQNGTRFIMLAGKPLDEPIAAQGPFVLNEREELHQAFDDYQRGKNGFEGAATW
jgi:redox-sensitive bicupin YhaK (pirin superfamily)